MIPELIVEIGFTAPLTGTALHLDDPTRGILDTNTLASTSLLTDVSGYVTSVSTRRGATRADGPYLRYEAGTCTITFRNDDRRFDPTNLAGPYVVAGVSQVTPMRAVRIRATYGGRTWPLWRGFSDQWTVGYDGPDSSYATVTCFDAFGVFAAHNRLAQVAVGVGEDTGQRITRILDSIGWLAGDRLVANGEETVQATTLADNVLTEMMLTADTELGGLWVGAEGRVEFRARSSAYSDARSRWPLAAFGDQVDGGVTTINLASNPSVETNLTGWAGGGFAGAPTVTRSNTRAKFGTWSVLGTWATTSVANIPHVGYTVTGLSVGRTYTFSVYVYVPSGSPHVVAVIAAAGFGGQTTVFDQWVRLSVTTTATATSHILQVWALSDTTAGQQVFLDGMQVEAGVTATDYCDGDQAGCEWDHVVHTSTSRRLPELPYADAELTYDALSITNQVTAARSGGTQQTAEDPTSVSAYLTRSHTRSDLIMQSDGEALMWAEQIVARSANPELRFGALLLKPSSDERLWAQAFGREIGDRIRVTRRPPGGGDPIEREVWVRGVEHTLTADQDWRTRFVLEQARDVYHVTDSFTTTASSGWGVADGGEVWTTTGGNASEYARSGGVATQTHPTVNVLHAGYITVPGSVNGSLSWDITCPVVPSGAPITLWGTARGTDVNNHYVARLSIATTGVTTLALFKRVGGALTSVGTSATLATHAAGNLWRLQFDVLGTLLRARAWRVGIDVIPDWQASTNDTSLRTGTQMGGLSRRESGNTDTGVAISFDNFAGSSRVTWS